MGRRQSIPRLWLITDERMGDGLMAAVARLPRGAGIVFRHYGMPARERRALFEGVQRVASRRGITILLGGPPSLARAWKAAGSHGPPAGHMRGLRSVPVHTLKEIRAAEQGGARLLFLSPLYPTASHPGRPALGRARFARLARSTGLPVIALGGVDHRRARSAASLGAEGWAAISAWLDQPLPADQKRKAVPM